MKLLKTSLACICCMLMLIIFAPSTYAISSQNLATDNVWVTGEISTEDEVDFYKITLNQPGMVDVTYQGLDVRNSRYAILSEDLDKVYCSGYVYNSSDVSPKTDSVTCVFEPGVYYIKIFVHDAVGRTGNYRLKASFTPITINEIGPNDTFEKAMPISLSQQINAILSEDDYADFYRISITGSKKIKINVNSKIYGMYFEIWDQDLQIIYDDYLKTGSEFSPLTFEKDFNLDPGTYYLKFCDENNTGRYSFTVAESYCVHETEIDYGYAATCTLEGLTDGTHCSKCDEILTPQQTIPAKGHTAVTDNAILPTCTTAGFTQGSHCSTCNVVLLKQEVIPATGHIEVADSYKAPTCTEDGLTAGSHCSVCNAAIKAQEKINATGHKYDKGKVTKAPTSAKAGVRTKICAVCGDKKTESVAKIAKTSVSSLSAKTRGFTVKWGKKSTATGYQIMYSTSKKFKSGNKTVTISKKSTVSKTVKSLKAKKKYYVKVRCYKVIDGKKYFGSWSKVNNITTKR